MFYSVLIAEGAELVRQDFSVEAWDGPPERTVGWWKSQMPMPTSKRMHWAPNDVMLQLFESLETQPDKQDMRYVLALLMVRRRVVRLEDQEVADQGRPAMVLYCPRRETTYHVVECPPEEARVEAIQEELARLLFANAA